MRKNKSKCGSTKYPNLYKYPTSTCWIFRKYSKEKQKEFLRSTGVEKDESRAYKVGLQAFNEWLGSSLPSGRDVLIKDIARAVLSAKEGKRDNTFLSARNQITNHIIPAFGHLRPNQLTGLKWDQYDTDERRKGKRTKLFNTRKSLNEIMRRAYEEGLIKRIPKLKNHDPETAPGRYLDDLTVMRILNFASSETRLLAQCIYRMGARPGEVLQYEYSMIKWNEDKHGRIDIPGRITKTGRGRSIPLNSVIARLIKEREEGSSSRFLFPSPKDPECPMRWYLRGWKTACRLAEVEANITDLRDTWVTNQARRGVGIVFAAKYIDTSVSMIEKIYAKAVPAFMQEVAG